jgi:hypothetical protein
MQECSVDNSSDKHTDERMEERDVTGYLLPLEALIETTRSLPEQITLQTYLSSVPGLSKEPCVASARVGAGSIHDCVITVVKTGQVLKKGPEAVRVLRAYGALQWMIQRPEQPHQSEQLADGLTGTSSLPRRVVAVTATQMQRLPHASRQVLSLVNGTNSLERIAHLLNKSPQEVYQILLALQNKGLIRL